MNTRIVGIIRQPSGITTGIVSNIPPMRRVVMVSHEVVISGTTWIVCHDEWRARVIVQDNEIVADFDNWQDAIAWKIS